MLIVASETESELQQWKTSTWLHKSREQSMRETFHSSSTGGEFKIRLNLRAKEINKWRAGFNTFSCSSSKLYSLLSCECREWGLLRQTSMKMSYRCTLFSFFQLRNRKKDCGIYQSFFEQPPEIWNSNMRNSGKRQVIVNMLHLHLAACNTVFRWYFSFIAQHLEL